VSIKDPINVSPQQLQERESLRQIEESLAPWLIQWCQQGSDFGRDGWVQIVDEVGPGGQVSPLTFLIQAKSEREAFGERTAVSIETRHLGSWNASPSSVLVALWSGVSRRCAFRTARDIVAELDRVRSGWREQTAVSVHFRSEHVLSGKSARDFVRRRVADEADALGGVKRFHQVRRRVLLTDLYLGTSSTAQTITASAPGKPDDQVVLGPGWEEAELDRSDVYAPRVLAGALLLFEEVLIPLASFEVVLRALEPRVVQMLLTAGHLVPVSAEDLTAFRCEGGQLRGKAVALHVHHEGDAVPAMIDRLFGSLKQRNAGDLLATIHRTTRPIAPSVTFRVVSETHRDLGNPAVRRLLGLSPHRIDDTSEPVWDAMLVNRLLHLNAALATAEELNVDVVEYEAGLSRLAAEKWYTELRFNRLFESVEAFDRVYVPRGSRILASLRRRSA